MSDTVKPPFRAAPAVLVAWVAALLALLFVQVRHPEPFLNDAVFHFGLVRSLVTAGERGQPFLDPWVGTWNLGFPVFHYYPNLPHLLVAALAKLSLGSLSLLQAFRAVEWLAVGTLPIPVYLCVRRLGGGRGAAAAAGILALCGKTDYLHGLDLESFTWQGLGQFAQAVGGWFLPLAFAHGYRALRSGEGMAGAAWLTTLTVLSHLVLGALAMGALLAAALAAPRKAPRRLLRWLVLAAVTAAGAAYLIVPLVRDFSFHNVSGLVPTWKYHSFGHAEVLSRLFRGELFDYGRPPLLSLLVGVGVARAAWRALRHARGKPVQPEWERVVLFSFMLFLLLFFGRPTWGALLDLVPLGRAFHWSRTLYGVQLFGAILAGLAAADLLRALVFRRPWGPWAAIAAALAFGAPLLGERMGYLRHNADLVREAAASWEAERGDLDAALALAAQDRHGRVYAGQGGPRGPGWGGLFQVGWTPVYSWFPQRGMDALGYLHHMASLNADLHAAFDEGRPHHYRAFNVRRVIAPPEVPVPPFAREAARFGRFRVLEVDGPGFVELVDAPFSVKVPRSNLSRVQRAWLSRLAPAGIHPVVRVEGALLGSAEVSFPDAAVPDAPRGKVLGVERRGDDFTADVRADRACALVLKQTYHPGWRVIVDGVPREAIHLLPSYVGVPLEPGRHRVEMRWDPGREKEILAGLGLLALLAFGALRRARRSVPTAQAAC